MLAEAGIQKFLIFPFAILGFWRSRERWGVLYHSVLWGIMWAECDIEIVLA